MRIRKSASRLLGSAYSASAAAPVGAAPPFDLPPPPPPPHLAPCSTTPESCSGSGFLGPSASSAEPCEISRSPWDLIADLSLSDPQVEDDIVDKYFVHVMTRSSWLFSATMPATSSAKKKKNLQAAAGGDSAKLRSDAIKKPAVSKEKVGDGNKKAKVKKEEGQDAGAPRVWLCKKNDDKRWHCNRPVSQPDTLCEYHFVQKRSYLNPDFEFPSTVAKLEEAAPAPVPVPAAASQSSTRNRPRKKKPGSDLSATEGFYYYAGFGPFRSKRQCRSGGGMNGPMPAKQEEDQPKGDTSRSQQQAEADEGHANDTNQTVTRGGDASASCEEDDTAGIAGLDEESSDDDFDELGICGHSMNGNGDPRAINGDGKRKIPWKRWRKPVKARSLKSLM